MAASELAGIRHELNNRLARIIALAEAVMDLVPSGDRAGAAADALIMQTEETAEFVRRALDPRS